MAKKKPVKAHVALPPRLIDGLNSANRIDAGIDAGIDKLVLDAVKRSAPDFDVTGAITAAELERTIDGASTISLTLFDPARKLLTSGIFESAVDIEFDGLKFRLAAVGKTGDELNLTFEERAVALLRRKDKPLKVSRDQVTRAQFIERLVKEVKTYPIDFYSPEAKPEKPKSKKKSLSERAESRSKGVASKAKITVKGQKANAEQLRNINRVMDGAAQAGARGKALQALVAACIVENEFYNKQGGRGDEASWGVLQAIPGRSGGIKGTVTKSQALDIEYICRSACKYSFTGFENNQGGGLIGVARRHPDWPIGRIAAVVINGAVNGGQGSSDYVTKVNGWRNEADKIIAAYGGEGGIEESGKYEFSRGDKKNPEDSWTCIKRLAEEVNYRAFVSANTLYYLSDEDLIKAQPQLILEEFDPGVSALDFDLDDGKKVEEVRLSVRTPRWRLAPGQVIELRETGPADGRWLVQSFRRSLFDSEAEVTLRRATKKLPEPKGEQSSSGVRGSSGDSAVLRAYSAAEAMTRRRFPYVWGGGHGSAGSPSGGGYDCSGSVAAVLAEAGLGYKKSGSVPVSGEMARSWGKPGKGNQLTMYANSEHVFLVFDIPGKKYGHFGTGDWGKGWNGPGFNPRPHPTAGFTARHWPGT